MCNKRIRRLAVTFAVKGKCSLCVLHQRETATNGALLNASILPDCVRVLFMMRPGQAMAMHDNGTTMTTAQSGTRKVLSSAATRPPQKRSFGTTCVGHFFETKVKIGPLPTSFTLSTGAESSFQG